MGPAETIERNLMDHLNMDGVMIEGIAAMRAFLEQHGVPVGNLYASLKAMGPIRGEDELARRLATLRRIEMATDDLIAKAIRKAKAPEPVLTRQQRRQAEREAAKKARPHPERWNTPNGRTIELFPPPEGAFARAREAAMAGIIMDAKGNETQPGQHFAGAGVMGVEATANLPEWTETITADADYSSGSGSDDKPRIEVFFAGWGERS